MINIIMRAKEFINQKHNLVFETIELSENQILPYYKERLRILNRHYGDMVYFSPAIFASGIKRSLSESIENTEIKPFIDKLMSLDFSKTIKVGELFSVIEVEIGFGWKEIAVSGFSNPKAVTNIVKLKNGKIKYIEFDDGTTYPRQTPATYSGQPMLHAMYFNSKIKADAALTLLQLSVPLGWKITIDPAVNKDNINEGGWANLITQNTHITPAVVNQAFTVLHHFIDNFNEYLKTNNIPPVELGYLCGSTTYYKRDMEINPTKEYGDIDVNLFIPKIEHLSNNANSDLYKKQIKDFCKNSIDFQTKNGTNVIFKIGNDYVQIDFIMAYYHNKEWTKALAPEYNVKGVLCNSLYSSLGEALNLSIGGSHGVQVKIQNDKIVPFRTVKGVALKTISNNPKTWALDIARFFKCKKISPRLKEYPGMSYEVRVSDIINSIKGIAETLEVNGEIPFADYASADELLQRIKEIYLDKINKVIHSTKFEKATSPAAIEKAEKTKEMLADRSQFFASLIYK